MATKLKTPTRTVVLTLTDSNDYDWSRDYIGNTSKEGLTRDPDDAVDYLCDDATAEWWEKQIAAQQEADNAVNELSSDEREVFDREASKRGIYSGDLGDQPGAMLALLDELFDEGLIDANKRD